MVTQAHLLKAREFQELVACNLLQTVVGIDAITAKEILKKAGGIHKLAQTSEAALAQVPGIGPKRAAKIKALTEWALLLKEVEVSEQVTIRSPADIANLLMLEMSLLEREEMRVIVLDTKHQVRTVETIYQGSLNTAVVRVAEIFRSAIINNAAAIVLLHNHPSGDPTPSPQDVQVTEAICQTGKELDIKVLDHLIFAGNRYVSLKEHGLAFG